MKIYSLFILLIISLCAHRVVAQTDEPMHITVTGPTGATVAIEGTLTVPADLTQPVPVMMLIGGSGSTDRNCNSLPMLHTNAFLMLADSLKAQGIAVLRYDKRYAGTNRVQALKVLPFSAHSLDAYVQDASAFIRQLQTDKRFSSVIVAGHSEGSLVGMLAAEQTKAAGFVSIAGPGRNIAAVMKTQLVTLPDTLRKTAYGILDSLRAGRLVSQYPPALGALFGSAAQPYIISWMRYEPVAELKRFEGPVLLINGERDFQVPVSEAILLKAARPDAQLFLFERMTHTLKDADSDRLFDKQKTYGNATLPLTPGLASTLARFVNTTAK